MSTIFAFIGTVIICAVSFIVGIRFGRDVYDAYEVENEKRPESDKLFWILTLIVGLHTLLFSTIGFHGHAAVPMIVAVVTAGIARFVIDQPRAFNFNAIYLSVIAVVLWLANGDLATAIEGGPKAIVVSIITIAIVPAAALLMYVIYRFAPWFAERASGRKPFLEKRPKPVVISGIDEDEEDFVDEMLSDDDEFDDELEEDDSVDRRKTIVQIATFAICAGLAVATILFSIGISQEVKKIADLGQQIENLETQAATFIDDEATALK